MYFLSRRFRPYTVQEYEVGLKVNGAHEFLFYDDGVYKLVFLKGVWSVPPYMWDMPMSMIA
jgi:hypothetical protein